MLTTSFPTPETLELHFDLPDDWDGLRKSPEVLGAALDALLAVGRTFPEGLVPPGENGPATNVVMTFATPGGDDILEREFLELCSCFPELHARMIEWVRAVNPTRMASGAKRPRELFTSILAHAGALAVVPLALRDPRYVDELTDHLRGVDLDHETFQGPLIAEIVRRHGLTPAVLRLIALRAVDKAGQNGFEDLRWLYERGGLATYLSTTEAREGFARLVEESSQRTSYRALYVAGAGKHLYASEPEKFADWLAFFEARGLVFDAQDRSLSEVQPIGQGHSGERDWQAVWDDAANCTDLD